MSLPASLIAPAAGGVIPMSVFSKVDLPAAALKRSHDEIDDSVAHGWQAWLRWWSVDSFFPASLG